MSIGSPPDTHSSSNSIASRISITRRNHLAFCPPISEYAVVALKAKSLRGGQNHASLLPHVNMPARLFVASCARCPRQLIGCLVCWCPRGRGFALRSGFGDGQGE